MDKSTRRLAMTLVAAVVAGAGIGYIDTRPNWDDTGVTAGALLVAGALLGAATPRWFWLTGLALGAPLLALNVALHGNYGSAIGLVVAVAGAGLGSVTGRLLVNDRKTR